MEWPSVIRESYYKKYKIVMKKKLLITMGCSYTEGVGCYDKSTIPPGITRNNVDYSIDVFPDRYNKPNKDRFHKFGFPNQLGKKLNYDKVINLGLGGSSTSGQLKQFTEKYLDKDFSNFDVFIFWFLSEPSRLSFYADYQIKNTMVTYDENLDGLLERGYVNMIKDIVIDPLLEQIFYIRMMEQICQNKGYELVISHSDYELNEKIQKKFKSELHLETNGENIMNNITGVEELMSPLCTHPNEKGYDLIAQRIYNIIEQHRPHLINTNKVDNFEWIWDGSWLNHKTI